MLTAGQRRCNRELLWDALKEGLIDCVVSDHSPCVESLKRIGEGDIIGAWGGISALGLGLSLLWTEGCKRGVSICQLVEWLSLNTAKHAGLGEIKGQLKVGYDADILIWDPDEELKVCLRDTESSIINSNLLAGHQGHFEIQEQDISLRRSRLARPCREDFSAGPTCL